MVVSSLAPTLSRKDGEQVIIYRVWVNVRKGRRPTSRDYQSMTYATRRAALAVRCVNVVSAFVETIEDGQVIHTSWHYPQTEE